MIAVDQRTGPLSATLLGSFVVTTLTHLVGRVPASGGPTSWRHTLFLLGAERLRDDVLDRLTDACETTRSGLVLAYRSVPPQVRQRIGRGNAAVAFMRLGNAEEAKAASEQIGTEHRFVVSQLTETVGTSVTDTARRVVHEHGRRLRLGRGIDQRQRIDVGRQRLLASERRRVSRPSRDGRSRSAQSGTSRGTSESVSLTAGISTSTAWGVSTSRATGDSESLARSLQRSRELLVEPSELQRLPITAMIVSYAAPGGRRVLLADANPAIGALRVATLTPLAEIGQPSAAAAGRRGQRRRRLAGRGAGDRAPPQPRAAARPAGLASGRQKLTGPSRRRTPLLPHGGPVSG